MKFLNKLGNILTILILFMFFLSIINQNIKYKPKIKLNKIDKNIVNCLDKEINTLETLKCLGENF